MMPDLTYAEATVKARSLLDIGVEEVYLSKGDYPWHLAVSCSLGGGHRLGIDASVWFRAVDPATGLHFRWSFEIEGREAIGKGHYEIDVTGCLRVLALLPPKARANFRRYLAACADKVEANAAQYLEAAKSESDTAATLRWAAKG